MFDIRPVGYVIGLLLAILGATMFLPFLVDLAEGRGHWPVFLQSGLITVLAGGLARHGGGGGEQLRLLLGVGLLGGFTTFSAFSLEMVLLIERGQYLFALLYAVLSIALGITGLMVGLGVMRMAG